MAGNDNDGMRPDWAQKDFYAVLGVKKDASADDIKKAYRRLARENHPDSNPGDTAKHDRFKQVAEAYDVVGDPDKRKKYDELRRMVASAHEVHDLQRIAIAQRDLGQLRSRGDLAIMLNRDLFRREAEFAHERGDVGGGGGAALAV